MSEVLVVRRHHSKSSIAVKRLFVFPYAGGGAAGFHDWFKILPEWLDICIIELPGRGRLLTKEPISEWPNLIDGVLSATCELLDLPFYIYGHSFGALLGFEFARNLLIDCGLSPENLFVASHRAPNLPSERPPLASLGDNELIDTIISYGFLPSEMLKHRDFLLQTVSTLKTDLRLCDNYVFVDQPKLSCEVIAFAGLNDNMLDIDEMFKWQNTTLGGFRFQKFPGGHMFQEDFQTMLLDFIKETVEYNSN